MDWAVLITMTDDELSWNDGHILYLSTLVNSDITRRTYASSGSISIVYVVPRSLPTRPQKITTIYYARPELTIYTLNCEDQS